MKTHLLCAVGMLLSVSHSVCRQYTCGLNLSIIGNIVKNKFCFPVFQGMNVSFPVNHAVFVMCIGIQMWIPCLGGKDVDIIPFT